MLVLDRVSSYFEFNICCERTEGYCLNLYERQENGDGDANIVDLIRSGLYRVVDTRSRTSREVQGFLPGWLATGAEAEETNKTVIYIAEQGQKHESCQENTFCYDGPMEVFNDMVVFPKGVSFQALVQLLNQKKIVLIDVRNASELIHPGKIPGSVHIPLYEISQAFQMPRELFQEKFSFEKPNQEDKNVVLTCRSGRRILVADSLLQNLGYNFLRLYYGSFKDWKNNGGKIV